MTALPKLLMMSLQDRIDAVAIDLVSKRDAFKEIDAHDLADALGMPSDALSDWAFVRYQEQITVEDYAESTSPASEIVYALEGKVTKKRLKELLRRTKDFPDFERTSFAFLSEHEREALENEVTRKRLVSNSSNGMKCIANNAVESSSGYILRFEGEIEDDGACIFLRTPYDERDGKFVNLDNCQTETW